MKMLLKAKGFVLLAWVVALTILLITAPNLSDLVRENGQPEVPDGYPSSTASSLLDHVHREKHREGSSLTPIVFHDKNGLSQQDLNEVEHAVALLKRKKSSLGITSIQDPINQSGLRDKLVSEDETTLIAMVRVQFEGRSMQQEKQLLYDALKGVTVDHYVTGNWVIQDDYMESTQEGLHRTEWLTLIFILLVLLLVFRSLIAPLLPLVTVGITFLATQAIVAFLVEAVQFPVSNFTQIFLVAVLFGIGTDYCILLLNRFKEELPAHDSVADAIVHTYKNAGRTMFFSGVAVLIGFSTIGLSTFSLYRSAAGVAIGVAVLMIALTTLLPIFMLWLGPKLFWPSGHALGHHESRFWGGMGRFALARPLLSLLLVACATVPFMLTYDDLKSYNFIEEIGDDYKSVKGFEYISKVFGPGALMPTTIVIENDEKMDERSDLQTIEAISREVQKVDHVQTVRSVTRPEGEPIENFLVPKQAKSLQGGLSDARDGIGKIRGGLAQARGELAASLPDLETAVNSFEPLISGTANLKEGVQDLKNGLQRIEAGLQRGAEGSTQLQNGLAEAEKGAERLADESRKLLNGYEQMQQGLHQLANHYGELQAGVQQIHDQLGTIDEKLKQLGQDHPEITSDPNYQYAVQATELLIDSSKDLNEKFASVNGQLNTLIANMSDANQAFDQLTAGQRQLAENLQKAVAGVAQLRNGLKKLDEGQQAAINEMPKLSNGLESEKNGQIKLQKGFDQLVDKLSGLTEGLGGSVKGLKRVSEGLAEAQSFLKQLAKSNSALAGFYIPDQVLKSKEFQRAIDHYMSPDRKLTSINVTFDVNPYSTTAIEQIDHIRAAVDRATEGTSLENAKVGIGGVTSVYNDLGEISNADYTRTAILMLIGIGLILIALLRSFIMPLYILLSLVAAYYTAMGISELIFVNFLGYSGISWAVPFFGFVMLITLGVDYSIFLMDRFNENRDLRVTDAILTAMKNMGTVILSAAIILGGTFAAMMPSGVVSLMEIATIIISGLVIYNLFVLPLFIPVMVKTFGKANWWPFRRTED
ncbi:MAG TPA: MMPL family transporter [Bacillales bacterium]|nr:MMPL family transporter [Bacillales bacterium]